MSDLKASVAEVKAAADIVLYIRGTGIALSPNGVGKWKGLCPFHQEKTPSFTVDEGFQSYKCWGCGVSGDLISFVMNTENLTFGETLRKLAEQYGVELDLKQEEGAVDYASLKKILEASTKFYQDAFSKLPPEHRAKKEVTDRGLPLTPPPGERGILYGYSPDGNNLYKHLKDLGYSDELLVLSGMCRTSEKTQRTFDFFRSRLMFTFTDRYGKPIGFSSRKLFDDDNRGKYVNSSESPLFHKARVFYNHDLARAAAGKSHQLYICEGQFDVNTFVASGLQEAVASSGTAFTQEHMEEGKRMVGEQGKLIFCFDGDTAGVKAAFKVFFSFPLIHDRAYAVFFPEGMDPCDYRLKHGQEAFLGAVASPQPLVEFIIKQTSEKYDMTSVLEKNKYVEECATIIKAIPSLTLRDSVARLVSIEAFTSLDDVKRAVAVAEPYDYTTSTLTREHQSAPKLTEEAEETSEAKAARVAALAEYIEGDTYYDTAARFISLGLSRKAWRSAVLRSKKVLPKAFHPLLQELSLLQDSPRLFPELFPEESEVAALLFQDRFTTFYKFLSQEELKDHFVYLHSRLEQEAGGRSEGRFTTKVLTLLQADEKNEVAYLRRLWQEEEKWRAARSGARAGTATNEGTTP